MASLYQSESSAVQPVLMRRIALLTLIRLVVNIGRRFAYPFSPAISRELGVPLTSVQNVIALQSGTGVASPFFGILSERYGRKRVMVGALGIMFAACLMGLLVPQFLAFALIMVLLGIAKIIFDPALQAYVGDHVPYRRRGMALGVVELSWAGSLSVAPFIGWLLDVGSLRLFFGVLAGVVLACILALAWAIPSDRPAERVHTQSSTLKGAFGLLLSSPASRAALLYGLLITAANEILFINYGAFMEVSFGLTLASLGAATAVISIAEVCGELVVITLSDRIGKRRLVLISGTLASFAYAILPLLNTNLTAALVGLFCMFLAVETAIVAAIPIYTEIMPEARSVILSGVAGTGSLGRLAGSLAGGWLYALTGSFVLLGLIALVLGLLAMLAVWLYISVNTEQTEVPA